MTNVFRSKVAFCACAGVLALMLPVLAAANPYLVGTDKFSFTGSVTVSGTSNDGTYTIPSFTSGATTYTGRDGSIYMGSDAPTALSGAGNENSNIFTTAWWYTTNLTQDSQSGYGNPNNTNTGFLQLYDAAGSTRTSSSGTWNNTLNQFTLSASGLNAPAGAPIWPRLWPAPLVGGAGELSKGTLLSYDLQLTADFTNPATLETGNWYSTSEHPINITGTFSGVFLNQSTTDPSLNGTYTFSYTLQNQNWAFDQGANLNGAFTPSYFAAAVPEPETYAMLLAGLGLLGYVGRRRQQKDAAAA